ncbi:MAG: hypothetical protein ABIH70_04600 [Chloroflexota bacterium]
MSNLQKERIIKEKLQKLIERIRLMKEVDNDHVIKLAKERINELQQRGIHGIDKFLQKLVDRANNKEDYLDILMEGRFAIILARNGFSDIEIEYCEKGPDLKAGWNRETVYFEVTRRRPSEDEKQSSSSGRGVYAVKRAKSEDIIGKIQGELHHLKGTEINIVVLWSDTAEWNENTVREAQKYIEEEICDDPNRYKVLGGILFTTGGYKYSTHEQFFLFENNKASKPLEFRLIKKLKSLHEQDLKQLKREQRELEAAFKRLRDAD